MNRRDFLKVGGLAAGVAMVPSIAQAHHANEPMESMIGVKLDLYKYPNGNTKVSRGVLISETGTQPPSGVVTEPTMVEVLDKIGPGGVVVGSVPAVTWITYGSEVTFDSTTGLPIIFGNIRTEPGVAIGRTARQNGIASEHWDSRLHVARVTNLGRDQRDGLWDTWVRHANIPPHDSDGGSLSFKGGFREVEQDNDYPRGERVNPGEIVVVTWQADGWATKRRFFVEVSFVWGG